MSVLEDAVKHIEFAEGFRGKPYQDTMGVWTIGHGLTYLTKSESQSIVSKRTAVLFADLSSALRVKYGIEFTSLTDQAQIAALSMAYQLGLTGCLRFRQMWTAVKNRDFKTAAEEALNSNWAKQTPSRAKFMSRSLKTCS